MRTAKMASEKKQYGLIIPNRRKIIGPAKAPKPSVFADESSSDEEGDTIRGKYGSSVWRETKKNAERLETHGSVVKALTEDPSVFEYDSLYDKMQEEKRKADPRLQKKDTKPKYIAQLKKTAERRKLEQELVYERKVQREMEEEGLESEDNEAYLTTAYKKKLEERKKLEEELREEEEIEKANDVTKQKDLTRFHQHLFDRITSGASGSDTTEKDKEKPSPHESPDKARRHSRESDQSDRRDRPPAHSDTSSRERERPHDRERRHSSPRRRSRTESGSQDSPRVHERTESVSSMDGVKSPTDETARQKEIEKEERRKVASAKRTDEEAQLSAKERYLARKKMKLSRPAASGQQ